MDGESEKPIQRPNPWTGILADSYHEIADELEDIAEDPDGDNVEERLHTIAADVRELAEHYEENDGE